MREEHKLIITCEKNAPRRVAYSGWDKRILAACWLEKLMGNRHLDGRTAVKRILQKPVKM
jgi:hypothetical protein